MNARWAVAAVLLGSALVWAQELADAGEDGGLEQPQPMMPDPEQPGPEIDERVPCVDDRTCERGQSCRQGICVPGMTRSIPPCGGTAAALLPFAGWWALGRFRSRGSSRR